MCVCVFQCLRAEDMNHFWHQRLPGETVLLSSTAERVHLHALDISTCLDGVRVWHQVGQSWERRIKGQPKFLHFFFYDFDICILTLYSF